MPQVNNTMAIPNGGDSPFTKILSPQDCKKLQEWNFNLPSPRNECVHDIIHQRRLEQPDALAISAWDGNITYAELDDLSSRLSRYLSSCQLEPGSFVPILFEKSKWTTVAMLGVMKASAAFVLLDPSYPIQRLQSICQDANSKIILSSSTYADTGAKLGAQLIVVAESTASSWPSTEPQVGWKQQVNPENALYVVFTSGSTGKPKGLIIEHRSFCTAAYAQISALRFHKQARILQFSSYAFDLSMIETLMGLMSGACLCVPSEEDRKGDLARWARESKVTWAILTPTVSRSLSHKDVPSLETLVLGGEALSALDVSNWAEHVHLIEIWGPAECTPIATYRHLVPGADYRNFGHGAGAVCWVVDPDDDQKLVPIGEAGEVVIEGPLVGRGYLNDDEKTAAMFINPPSWLQSFRRGSSSRVYKTGDLARHEPDGSLTFVARKDLQVKIRGQRVELGEIENAIHKVLQEVNTTKYPYEQQKSSTADNLTVLRVVVEMIRPEYRRNNPLLASFVRVGAGKDHLTWMHDWVQEVRPALQKILPAHMIPSIWFPIEAFPQSGSGKLDRLSLRQLGSKLTAYQVHAMSQAAATAGSTPSTDMEVKLQKLWEEILQIPADLISIDQNFIQLGGDSLMAMRLVAAARLRGISLTVATVLQYPILRDMAKYAKMADEENFELEPFSLLQGNITVSKACAQAASLCGVDEASIEDIYPCSTTQMGLTLQSMIIPGASMFQHLFQLPKDTNLETFLTAWNTTVKENQILRTRIIMDATGFVQVVLKHSQIHIPILTDLEEYRAQDMKRHMSVAEPLCRYAIFQSEKYSSPLFLWTAHHALYDGHSMELLLDQATRYYRQEMPAPLVPYCHYIKAAFAEDSDCDKYWHSRLNGVESMPFPRYSIQDQVSAKSQASSEVPLLEGLQLPITLPNMIRACLALVLAKHSSTKYALYGEIVSGRNAPIPGIERIVGPTSNPVPVIFSLDDASTISKYLQTVQAEIFSRVRYETIDITRLRQSYPKMFLKTILLIQPDYSLSHNSLFEKLDDVGTGEIPNTTLLIECFLGTEKLKLKAAYDENIVSKEIVEQILADFSYVLDKLVLAQPSDTLGPLL